MWIGSQMASCLQLQDELMAELGGGQLGGTGTTLHAPNKNHPDLRKPFLASGKTPLSSHSWQFGFLKGSTDEQQSRAEPAQSLTDVLFELRWLIPGESAKTSSRTTLTILLPIHTMIDNVVQISFPKAARHINRSYFQSVWHLVLRGNIQLTKKWPLKYTEQPERHMTTAITILKMCPVHMHYRCMVANRG